VPVLPVVVEQLGEDDDDEGGEDDAHSLEGKLLLLSLFGWGAQKGRLHLSDTSANDGVGYRALSTSHLLLVLNLALQPSACDLSVAGAHPPVVPQGHIFGVKLFQELREVVRQLCQYVVVRLESPVQLEFEQLHVNGGQPVMRKNE